MISKRFLQVLFNAQSIETIPRKIIPNHKMCELCVDFRPSIAVVGTRLFHTESAASAIALHDQ